MSFIYMLDAQYQLGCTVSICGEAMPYEPFINFYTKMGAGHIGGQLRPESYAGINLTGYHPLG